MAMKPHPVTGVLINDIETRQGPISEKERETARLLFQEGYVRWVVAAMLGRFPLEISNTGDRPERPRGKYGRTLSTRDAARDPRQISMEDIHEGFFADLFGDGQRLE